MGCYAIGGSLWNLVSWNWKGWYPIGESVFLRSIFFRKQKVGPRKILIQVIVLMIFLQDQFPCYIADVPNDQVPYRSQFKHSTQTIFQGAQILNNRFVWMVLYCVTYGKKTSCWRCFCGTTLHNKRRLLWNHLAEERRTNRLQLHQLRWSCKKIEGKGRCSYAAQRKRDGSEMIRA